MSFPICTEYENHNPRGIIISFHGGCFTGGNMTYDAPQNNMLCNMGFIVYQPEFPKKYSAFKTWCQEYIPPFQKRNLPIYVLGRSSGGYLAKYVYNNFTFIHNAIYICPIMFPKKRYQTHPRFKKNTISFFDHTEDNMNSYDDNEHIILGIHDENMPYNLFSHISGGNILTYNNHISHSDILTQSNPAFQNLIQHIYLK